MIYLDNAASTHLCDAAKNAILEHIDDFGNPSSSHELGREARLLIESARERIAKCINAEPNEVYFTSGGSEANTWALHNKFSLSSSVEHHSLRSNLHIQVDKYGRVDPCKLEKTICNAQVEHWYPIDIVSCMYVNNEIGTINDVKMLSQVAHDNNVLFHSDAVQALPHIKVDVKDLNVDMLSASAHKFNGPRGVGFLYVKGGTKIEPLIYGGLQESGLRSGTENVLGIIAMAAALEETVEHMETRNELVGYLRDDMLSELLKIDGSHLHGSVENRICSNINIRFDGVSGKRLVSLCDMYGVCISTGSACNQGLETPSHVLKGIGMSNEEALSSVRISIGHQNTLNEVLEAANTIKFLVERVRENE